MRLVLLDIDGTLLSAGDLSRRSFLHVLKQFAGPGAMLGRYSLAGKTDPQIMNELLLQNAMPPARIGDIMDEALASYQSCYLSQLQQADIRPLEGAHELVEGLTTAAADVLLGILSGNMYGLVAPKLKAAGIASAAFHIVACGSDKADRDELPAIAVARAQDYSEKRILPRDVVIVGDTPLDVRCAKRFGAVSVAVATGDYTYEELRAAKPTYVLNNLLAWSDVENIIGSPLDRIRPVDGPQTNRPGSVTL